MLTIRIGEKTYELPLEDVLGDLTGEESARIEEFIGGWENFQTTKHATRSMIVMLWLAKRHAGETDTLEDVAAIRGLVFGGMVEVSGDDDAPNDPAEDAGRPLAEQNGSNGSNDGNADSADGLETSDSSGLRPLPEPTHA